MSFESPGFPATNDESLDLQLTAPAADNARRAFGWVDFAVLGLLAAFIYALVTVAREWSGGSRLPAGAWR